MTIGFDAKRLFHNTTGLGNYSRTLVQNLHQWHPAPTYHLFVPNRTDSLLKKYPYFSQQNFQFSTNQKMPSSVWRSWGLTREWTTKKIDLFHGLSNELPFASSTSTKKVLTIHDLIFKTLPSTYPLFDRLIYDKKVKHSCHQADKIVAISQQTKKDLITYYDIDPNKIEVIYQAVNSIFYDTTSPIKETSLLPTLPKEYILCVGTLESRKNQLSILQAWRMLPTSLQLPIVFVGKGKTYKKTLINYAYKHQIAPIYWLDNVQSNEVLKVIYQKASLFIYPSKYEGFGLPVVEALLSNVPVITSNIASLPEAAGSHSLLIDPMNIESIMVAIKEVLENSKKRQEMIEAGNRFAQATFNPKKLSEEMMNLYSSLI